MTPQALIISFLYLFISGAINIAESILVILSINALFHFGIALSIGNIVIVWFLLNVVLRNGYKLKLKLENNTTDKKSQLING